MKAAALFRGLRRDTDFKVKFKSQNSKHLVTVLTNHILFFTFDFLLLTFSN